jgi:hypothetical protein
VQINKFKITKHAARRMAQRNLDLGDVALVLRFGRRIFNAGAKFYFLGSREVAGAGFPELERLEGTVIVTSHSGSILTIYRNRRALARIKRLKKRTWKRQRPERGERKRRFGSCPLPVQG